MLECRGSTNLDKRDAIQGYRPKDEEVGANFLRMLRLLILREERIFSSMCVSCVLMCSFSIMRYTVMKT